MNEADVMKVKHNSFIQLNIKNETKFEKKETTGNQYFC